MNSKSKKLIKNTFIVAFGKICTQFVSFILLPFYTAYLSTSEFGVVDLLNSYISLLLPLVFLQIDQAVFRFLIDARNDIEQEKQIITSAFVFIIIETIVCLIFYFIVSNFISNNYKFFLCFNVLTSMLSNLILQINRGMGDNLSYSIGCLISGIGTIIFNILFIKVFKMGAYGVLTASLIANIMCIVVLFIKTKIYKYINIFSFTFCYLKKLLKYSIPLVPNILSWWIINVSDRTIISTFIGVSANGIFSAANKFSTIFVSLFNIFSMTWSESAALYINDKDKDFFFSKIINNSILLFSSLCIMGIAVMPFVFNIFINNKEFFSAYNQISILLVATIFNIIVSLFGSIYIALKKTKEIAKTSIYSAIINILINVLLIKRFGLYAASLSTLISYFLMALYRYIDVKKYVKIKLEYKKMFFIIVILIFNLIVYYFGNKFICLFNFIFTTLFFVVLNKKIITSIFYNLIKVKYKKIKH